MGSPTTELGEEATRRNIMCLSPVAFTWQVRGDTGPVRGGDDGEHNSLSPTPSNWPNNPNRPVEKVLWDDSSIFTRLNQQQAGNLPAGWSYVLPTESQWEYACRAGTTTAYSWGTSIASSNAN